MHGMKKTNEMSAVQRRTFQTRTVSGRSIIKLAKKHNRDDNTSFLRVLFKVHGIVLTLLWLFTGSVPEPELYM